jgi:putative lipoic acid-binding regulatory protein
VKSKPTDSGTPQDGFDLIEYPCDYSFKAMCRVNDCTSQTVIKSIQKLVLEQLETTRFVSAHSNRSRTGKFESVTIKVKLNDRSELEAIYSALSASSQVVMTL